MRREGGGPAAFDPSEFPSLAPGVGAPGGMPGRPNYGKEKRNSMDMYGVTVLDAMIIPSSPSLFCVHWVSCQVSGFPTFSSVTRIRDVLIRIRICGVVTRIRIRIREAVTRIRIRILLFCVVTFMLSTKRKFFLPSFFAFYLPKVNSHKFSKIIKVTKNCKNQGFFLFFLVNRRIRIRTNYFGSGWPRNLYRTGTLIFMFLKYLTKWYTVQLSVSMPYHCNCLDCADRLPVASPYCNVLP
jgi:hypothetical protein